MMSGSQDQIRFRVLSNMPRPALNIVVSKIEFETYSEEES